MNDFARLGPALIDILSDLEGDPAPVPTTVPALPEIAPEGLGLDAVPDLWRLLVEGGAKLGSGLMMGHMDTAPHPVAVLSDALVSALNNNLLFRELSPIASRVEEAVIKHMAAQLALPDDWSGTFVSGGSLANLTALFAACGGFAEVERRDSVAVFVPEHAHVSIRKSACVLGIPAANVQIVPGDAVGRPDPASLDAMLSADDSSRRIVVAAVGSTIHGAIDPIGRIAQVARRHGAWFHVDAFYGGAIAYSQRRRAALAGIEDADSIVVGPQKWLYVPRLNGILMVKGRERFDRRLGVSLPYSLSGEEHRGRWGLQGSRRASAIAVWMMLQVFGPARIGEIVDASVARTQRLHALLSADPLLEPTHTPDLNLQCFRLRSRPSAEAMARIHRCLAAAGGPWVSLSRWRDEPILRSVLLSQRTTEAHLRQLIEGVHRASAAETGTA